MTDENFEKEIGASAIGNIQEFRGKADSFYRARANNLEKALAHTCVLLDEERSSRKVWQLAALFCACQTFVSLLCWFVPWGLE